jgi:hypothetical protein
MIDFKNAAHIKLKPIPIEEVNEFTNKMLLDDENIEAAFHTIRDQLILTNKRIISIDIQGLTGKKIDFTSIPYSRIQTFSVETVGVIDGDCELQICVSSMGCIKFYFESGFDIISFNKLVSKFIL